MSVSGPDGAGGAGDIGGWCFVRVIFIVVVVVNSVGGGENIIWPQCDGERDECTCHLNALIEGILGWQGGQEYHK
jgi:hypothetical protein